MMVCGSSIVLRENIRKVYVNGHLDHEENLGIGLCAYEIDGKGRVLTSWPKREKVLKINDVPYVYIGRTAQGRPICWTTEEEYDRTPLLPVKVNVGFTYHSSIDGVSIDEYIANSATSMSIGFLEEDKDTIALRSYIGTPPDHYGERSKYAGESVVKNGNLETDIDIAGRWYGTETSRLGTISGYVTTSMRFHVGHLSIAMEEDNLNASVSTGDYIVKDQGTIVYNRFGEAISKPWFRSDWHVSITNVNCSVEDCEEEED